MLYMVIERFRDLDKLAERFQAQGRMQPDGLTYHASWIEPSGTRCFQLMETDKSELMKVWTSRWDDIMDFQIIPVLTSAEFWAKRQAG